MATSSMTPAPEKAAPIPAEVLALAENAQHRALKYVVFKDPENVERAKAAVRFEVALAILADREARPSLPDSRKEQIREDERRIIARVIRRIAKRFEPRSASQNNHRALADAIESGDAFSPADRARQGGNNG